MPARDAGMQAAHRKKEIRKSRQTRCRHMQSGGQSVSVGASPVRTARGSGQEMAAPLGTWRRCACAVGEGGRGGGGGRHTGAAACRRLGPLALALDNNMGLGQGTQGLVQSLGDRPFLAPRCTWRWQPCNAMVHCVKGGYLRVKHCTAGTLQGSAGSSPEASGGRDASEGGVVPPPPPPGRPAYAQPLSP